MASPVVPTDPDNEADCRAPAISLRKTMAIEDVFVSSCMNMSVGFLRARCRDSERRNRVRVTRHAIGKELSDGMRWLYQLLFKHIQSASARKRRQDDVLSFHLLYMLTHSSLSEAREGS